MQHVARWISALPIKTKMLAGFGCVLVILVAVAGVGYWRFLGVEGSFQDYAQRVGVVAISREIDRAFSELRRHVREFAFTGDPGSATAAAALTEQVKAKIDRGVATIVNPERQRLIGEVAVRFASYRKSVDTVFAIRREQDRLVHDTMDPAGVAARSDFDTLITNSTRNGNDELATLAHQGQQALMLVRLNANKVIDRRGDDVAAKRAEQVQTDLTRLTGLLDTASVGSADRAIFEGLRQRLGAYEKAYREAIRLAADLARRIDGMKHDAETVEAAANAVKDSGIADEQAIEAATLTGIETTKTLLLVLTAGDARGATATLHVKGREALRVPIGNISRGSVALRTEWSAPAGTEVEVELPGGARVAARMVRNEGGLLALAFRQDATVLQRVDAALEQIAAQGVSRAAA